MTLLSSISNPREAAYVAVLAALREERYLEESLEMWQKQANPIARDQRLAKQLAYGTIQRALSLDYLAEKSSTHGKLSLKLKEKALLRLGLYQIFFLEKIPLYAIVDESVQLAKRYCHETFARFLNATLRKLGEHPNSLPEGDSIEDLTIRFSYPRLFVERLLQEHGIEKTKEILAAENAAAPTFVRIRPGKESLFPFLELIQDTPCDMALLTEPERMPEIAASAGHYIQNITPANLVAELALGLHSPKRILDLCASPGGKLIGAHDAFPSAELYANDLSEEKLQRVRENCGKYQIAAHLSCGPGEHFQATEPFDLIILDTPCSNTGVLNKRPEARWRITQEALSALALQQYKLLAHAKSLLAPDGEIWYMTCSILREENEGLVSQGCHDLKLQIRKEIKTLPNLQGWDGGYAAALKNR